MLELVEEDEVAVRRVASDLLHALDRGDGDLWAEHVGEHAYLRLLDATIRGRSGIASLVRDWRSSHPLARLMVGRVTVEVATDRAIVAADLNVLNVVQSLVELVPATTRAQLVRHGDRWLIRCLVVDAAGPRRFGAAEVASGR